MDWPHDPDGEQGSEGRRKYGHAIVAKKIDEESDFPLDVAAFLDEYGDDPVRIDAETVVPVRDLFEGVDAAEFDDFPTLHQALGESMRANDYWFYEGPEAFVDGA
ncbi:DUF5785 family protein [Haloplanus halobius]|uniref:DUF5785 family protein n=1 Tax=Haloplanus halobius TaxID=2934938 RepID=UPI00200E9673|nr:DUF5785 family protein [Haloplanus sp. XH21]